MRTALIYNPVAGAIRRRPAEFQSSVEILKKHGHEVRLQPTTAPQTAGPIARAAIAEGAQMIVVAGGDGTINEAANGMIKSGVPLAPLPAGTANVLCMEIGLGRRMVAAAEKLARCVPERISAGRLITQASDRYFLMMAGAGVDALVCSRLNANLKNRTGKFAYWVAGLGMAGRKLELFNASLNGEVHRCSFALASRVRNYGGDLEIAGGASLRSHEFETVLFDGASSLRYAKYLAGVVLRCVTRLKGVTVRKASSIDLAAEPGAKVYLQVDGELAGALPARIEIARDALTLMMPKTYR